MNEPRTAIAAAPVCTGAEIRLERVSIAFGTSRIVSGIDLTVAPGEFVCLLGPSGCGKSTLLNLVAGFLPPSAGRVSVGGKAVTGPGVDRGVVFQSTEALFPWLQIARVLINRPSVVLMDEPFGALDAQTREVMQAEVDRLWRATKQTILFITHDIWEAILLGDRIITMTAGPDAHFKKIALVDIPHPRDLTTPTAVELYRDLRENIASEVRRTLQAQGLVRDAA